MMAALALPDPQPVSAVASLDRFDTTSLAAKLSQAQHLFAAGDMQKALVMSGAAYDEAKAAQGFAKRMKAGEEVIARVGAMIDEALEIESYALVALANEFDQAQAAGVVASRGRPKKVASEDLFRLEDIGLDKRRILHARKLRDAELKEPGVIRKRIALTRAEGGMPSRNNLRAAVGTASASKEERGKNFYQTPAVATIALLAYESFSSTVWEPACGYNAIGRVMEGRGYDVILSDLVDRGTISEAGDVQAVGDFLLSVPEEEGEGPDIVTNPPYGDSLNAFIAHALRVHKPRKLALLLNLNVLAGFADDDRNFVMDECPPVRIYVFKRRLPMMHREGYTGPKASSRMNTAWVVWERQEDGTYGDTTIMRRIDWMDFADADTLEPGEGGHSLGISFDAPRTTPKLELHERVDRDREDARAWVLQRDEFDRAELCRGIGRRDSTVEAIIAEFVSAGLISPASEPGRLGRHRVLASAVETAADRDLYERAAALVGAMDDDLTGVLIRATRVSSDLGIEWEQAIELVKRIEADGNLVTQTLPLPTADELGEWKILGVIRDGGGFIKVTGPDVEALADRGLILPGEQPSLTEAGEARLGTLQRIVEAATDGDVVACRPAEGGAS
ncbi:MAG TPA: hypothetical protein VFY63_08650 [Pseudorhizobium sp.]|nr:hypothetical protein [Pseudorhizobium sp.]